MKVIDYVLANDHQAPASAELSRKLHTVQRACRRIIGTATDLTPDQRLRLLLDLDDALEEAGL